MTKNPFIFGAPIRDPDQFFGRKAIIQRIFNRLRSMQDSSIIGERRMGKTSLLYHLQEPGVIHEYGLDESQYLLVYFSFEGAGQLTPTRFWQRLLRSLSEKIDDETLRADIDRLREMDEIDPFDIEDLFLDISDKGWRIVFLLDEFETVTQATNLDADFFSHLRSLATGRYIGLIFVTSSRQKLSELSHAGIVGSPFFNIFETFFLKPFKTDSAETVVENLLAKCGTSFDPQEQAYLMALSGRHPFFLQMAASYLFDAHTTQGLKGEQLRPARLERVEREFLDQAQAHFTHYWNISTKDEKIFLVALSTLSQSQPEQPVIPDMEQMKRAYRQADIAAQVLGDRGLVLREGGGYQIFSPIYEQWIIKEITRTRGKGDYQSWLEQNKSDYGGLDQVLYDQATDIAATVNPTYWPLITEWLSKSDDPSQMLDQLKQAAASAVDRSIWLRFIEE